MLGCLGLRGCVTGALGGSRASAATDIPQEPTLLAAHLR